MILRQSKRVVNYKDEKKTSRAKDLLIIHRLLETIVSTMHPFMSRPTKSVMNERLSLIN